MSGTRPIKPTIQLDSGLIVPASAVSGTPGATKVLGDNGAGTGIVSWVTIPTGAMPIYTTNVGDGVHSTFTFTHGLGTTHAIPRVVESSTGEVVFPTVTVTPTQVTVTFAPTIVPTSNQYLLTLFAGVAPAMQTWTPVWASNATQPVLNNGTLTGRYQQSGKIVTFSISLVAGSTTTFGTGAYSLTLPIAAAATGRWACTADLLDTGVQHYTGAAMVAPSGTQFEDIVFGSNTVGPVSWQATSPFTFGSTDRLTISGSYEVT